MRWFLCLLLAFAWLLAGCSQRLESPQTHNELVVAIRGDPVFYQPASGEEAASGFENDLLQAFAEELKVKLKLVPVQGSREMRELLRTGKVHFAAALPLEPSEDMSFTQPLHVASQVIVQQAGAIGPDEAADLAGRSVQVATDSPLDGVLRALKPTVAVAEVDTANDIDLLARVSEGKAELAATDSAHFDVAVNFYPDIEVALELPGTVTYAWAFLRENDELRRQADAFITRIRTDGTLARIRDRYYGHIKRVRPDNMAQFLIAVQTRLPEFRGQFQQAERMTGIDWRMLAALAYQESNWDPLATSPTGVRGMMMLTEDTADYLGVSNRLNARESINAGARYLSEIADSLPDEIAEPDRTWLALAAYNVGMGHFNGARALAKSLKRDPDSWFEMKKVLPLLARPQYYQRLKSGRGRGGEAVIMVENIRNFYNVLARFEKPLATPPLPSVGIARSGASPERRKAPGKIILPSGFW